MMLDGREIKGIMIGEVVGILDNEEIEDSEGKEGKIEEKVRKKISRNIGIEGLIVVESVIIEKEKWKMVVRDWIKNLIEKRKNVEKEKKGKKKIFLEKMVGEGEGDLIEEDSKIEDVEKIEEEFKEGRGLINEDKEFLRKEVGGGDSRNGKGNEIDKEFIERRKMGIWGKNGKRIWRSDEDKEKENEVEIEIEVGGGEKIRRMDGNKKIVEIIGIEEVWIRVMEKEIRKGKEIEEDELGRKEEEIEDLIGIRKGKRMNGVEINMEEEFYNGEDGGEIEKDLNKLRIIGKRIEDEKIGIEDIDCEDIVDIDIGWIWNFIMVDKIWEGEDRLGDILGWR